MKTIAVGALNIAQISLGAGPLGDPNHYDMCAALMDRYLDLGGNCFDVARIYGSGLCEVDFSKWLQSRKCRSDIIISTKGAHPDLSAMHVSRLSPGELRGDLTLSLAALKTDYVDIYYLHRDHVKTPVEDIMPTLHAFVKEGKVRELGASNWTAGRIAMANKFALDNGLTPFSVSQINWSLAVTTPAQTGDNTHIIMNDIEYDWYKTNDFPIMAYSPQARGYFARAILGNMTQKLYDTYSWFDENLRRVERVKTLSAQTGFSPTAIITAYLLHKDVRVSPILGFSSRGQMDDSMTALDITLTTEQMVFLEGGTLTEGKVAE